MDEKIAEFVKVADRLIQEHYARSSSPMTVPTHYSEILSHKWCRIVTLDPTGSRSVYAFIALQDNYTKALGQIKRGDIYKAAGWKAPAKHARGNIFDENFAQCLNEYGVKYLRG